MLPLSFISAMGLVVVLGISGAAGAQLAVQETPLNVEGGAYEINADAGGVLWISENGAEEIWGLGPTSGAYTVYHGAGRVSDARRAGDGSVWWIDQREDSLRRLWPDSGEFTTWRIPGATTLLGTAIDETGAIWLSQFFDPEVYRFTVGSSELCTYIVGPIGGSNYVLANGSDIWLGDWINDTIRRLEPGSGVLTSWPLPSNSSPEGLAIDGDGHLWWADPDRHHLARLEPEEGRLTTYALPWGSLPQMVAVSGGRIWYTEDWEGSVGRLDPALASGDSKTVISDTTTLTPVCSQISLDTTGVLTTSSGSAAWASAVYTSVVDADGWSIHELPSEDAYPWGIAASRGEVWMVDYGRQVLARLRDSLSVTACKVADEDGELSTSGDQTRVEDWTMYLRVDGARQEPGRPTGPGGCVTWTELEAGVSYGVEEEVRSGWTALTPSSHDFGVATAGELYSFTFVNYHEPEQAFIYLPLVVRNRR
jgi:streptogramin lyase